MRARIKKFLFIIFLVNCFDLNIFANSEELITICDIQKSAMIIIEPRKFDEEGKLKTTPTRFKIDEKPTGERYTLSLVKKGYRNMYREAAKLGFFNIYYSSKGDPSHSWNALDHLKTGNGKGEILHKEDPLIIRIHYPGPSANEQLYYFKLNKDSSGIMTMVNTRWGSPLDMGNNQMLFYATCRNPCLVSD